MRVASAAREGDSMTEKEAIKLLALIKVAYPSAYRDMDDASKRATVAMWHKTFASVPYPIMEMAYEQFRRVSKFPPTVAEMFDELEKVYYMAVEESFMASMRQDADTIRRCQFIMDHTYNLRGSSRPGLDVGRISDNLLMGGNDYEYQPMREGLPE